MINGTASQYDRILNLSDWATLISNERPRKHIFCHIFGELCMCAWTIRDLVFCLFVCIIPRGQSQAVLAQHSIFPDIHCLLEFVHYFVDDHVSITTLAYNPRLDNIWSVFSILF
jgi:hypothetical protein